MILVDLKMVIGVLHRRKCVGKSAILLNELVIIILLWIALRTEEKHVLAEMCEASDLVVIEKVTHANVGSCCSLVSIRITDEQYGELIVKLFL